jgi:hypothetical protein
MDHLKIIYLISVSISDTEHLSLTNIAISSGGAGGLGEKMMGQC